MLFKFLNPKSTVLILVTVTFLGFEKALLTLIIKGTAQKTLFKIRFLQHDLQMTSASYRMFAATTLVIRLLKVVSVDVQEENTKVPLCIHPKSAMLLLHPDCLLNFMRNQSNTIHLKISYMFSVSFKVALCLAK